MSVATSGRLGTDVSVDKPLGTVFDAEEHLALHDQTAGLHNVRVQRPPKP